MLECFLQAVAKAEGHGDNTEEYKSAIHALRVIWTHYLMSYIAMHV